MRLFGALLAVIPAFLLQTGCMQTCIVEGTLIATPEGPAPVEALRVGDVVTARGFDGATTESTVSALSSSIVRRSLLVEFEDGRVLRVTSEHPVMVGGRWRRAGSIRRGDLVALESGEARAERVTGNGGPARVFDLTVEPHGTFFANGVLVHNKTVLPNPTVEELAGAWIGIAISGTIYRLVLQPDGTGTLSTMVRSRSVETRREGPISWSLDRYSIEVEGGYDRAHWEGTAYVGLLLLHRFQRPSVDTSRFDVAFRREADFVAEMDALRGSEPANDGPGP